MKCAMFFLYLWHYWKIKDASDGSLGEFRQNNISVAYSPAQKQEVFSDLKKKSHQK